MRFLKKVKNILKIYEKKPKKEVYLEILIISKIFDFFYI